MPARGLLLDEPAQQAQAVSQQTLVGRAGADGHHGLGDHRVGIAQACLGPRPRRIGTWAWQCPSGVLEQVERRRVVRAGPEQLGGTQRRVGHGARVAGACGHGLGGTLPSGGGERVVAQPSGCRPERPQGPAPVVVGGRRVDPGATGGPPVVHQPTGALTVEQELQVGRRQQHHGRAGAWHPRHHDQRPGRVVDAHAVRDPRRGTQRVLVEPGRSRQPEQVLEGDRAVPDHRSGHQTAAGTERRCVADASSR